jgi:hypothetical protein
LLPPANKELSAARHCEERSDEAISIGCALGGGSTRFIQGGSAARPVMNSV